MEALVKIVGILALTVLYAFFRLFVLLKIWAICMTPLGLPQIGMWKMFAVTWFLTAATHRYDLKDEKQDMEKAAKIYVGSAVGLLISWGLAYLIFS